MDHLFHQIIHHLDQLTLSDLNIDYLDHITPADIDRHAEIFMKNFIDIANSTLLKPKSFYDDVNNVHDRSIQESMKKSIANIMADNVVEFNSAEFFEDENISESVKSFVRHFMKNTEKHVQLGFNFKQLFIHVWDRVKRHDASSEIKKILDAELSQIIVEYPSYEICFIGLTSTLVNVLSGFYDDVIIEMGEADQIASIIETASKTLGDSYSVEAHKDLVRQAMTERGYDTAKIEEWIADIE